MLLNDRKLSNEKLNTLASNVDRLSRLLTRQRENLPAAYLKDRGLREAYAAYFLPPNMRKIHIPLSELALHPDTMVNKEQYRILDLGCGPGTALLGVLDFFYSMNISPRLDVVAIDQLSENLAIVRSFFSTYKLAHSLNASLKTICSSIGNTVHMIEEPFDLITLTNVLNELHPHHEMRIAKRIRLLADLLHRYLAKDGSCIIIEPAL